MGLFRYILGGEARRNLKKLDKMADKVLALETTYLKMTDEQLIGQTAILKKRLNDGGLIAIVIMCRVKKLNPVKLLDAVILGVMLAQVLGRWEIGRAHV